MKVYKVDFYKNSMGYPETVEAEFCGGIFSTKEKAAEYIKNFNLKEYDEEFEEEDRECFEIEEFELDKIQ